jgi:hypothetical protein
MLFEAGRNEFRNLSGSLTPIEDSRYKKLGTECPLEEKREYIFELFIQEKLLLSLYNLFRENGINDINLLKFSFLMSELEPEDVSKFLAVPFEHRYQWSKLIDLLKAGYQEEIKDFIKSRIEIANKYGFLLGYHTSPNRIEKVKKRDGQLEWDIVATDPDDRYDGHKKAYCSTSLEGLYDNNFQYLYVVRVMNDYDSDNQGDWRITNRIPIISEIVINRNEIDEIVDQVLQVLQKKKKES